MLFNRFDVQSEEGWAGAAYNEDNNINGIDGDTNGDGVGQEVLSLPLAPEIEDLEQARIRAIIDAVNEFDNVLYEVCNEGYGDALDWQEWVAEEIRTYQETLPNQHLVGITGTLRFSAMGAITLGFLVLVGIYLFLRALSVF